MPGVGAHPQGAGLAESAPPGHGRPRSLRTEERGRGVAGPAYRRETIARRASARLLLRPVRSPCGRARLSRHDSPRRRAGFVVALPPSGSRRIGRGPGSRSIPARRIRATRRRAVPSASGAGSRPSSCGHRWDARDRPVIASTSGRLSNRSVIFGTPLNESERRCITARALAMVPPNSRFVREGSVPS